MPTNRQDPTDAPPYPPRDVQRMRAAWRRQAALVDSLRDTLPALAQQTKMLQAESADLRARAARLRRRRRAAVAARERAGGRELAETVIAVGVHAPGAAREV